MGLIYSKGLQAVAGKGVKRGKAPDSREGTGKILLSVCPGPALPICPTPIVLPPLSVSMASPGELDILSSSQASQPLLSALGQQWLFYQLAILEMI